MAGGVNKSRSAASVLISDCKCQQDADDYGGVIRTASVCVCVCVTCGSVHENLHRVHLSAVYATLSYI